MFNEVKEKYKSIDSYSYDYLEYSMPTSLLLGVTNQCNLKCNYCFVEQNPMIMSLETAEKAIEWVKKK
jgi:MoaA/NifB/PqqE/SkfB family radical SAM enzyme